MKSLIVQDPRAVAKKIQEDKTIRLLEAARVNLGNALTIPDIKKIGDSAESLKVYVIKQKLSKEVLAEAMALMIDSKTKLGEALDGIVRKGGDLRNRKGPTLSELGINNNESHECQYLFRLRNLDSKLHSQVRQGARTLRMVILSLRGTPLGKLIVGKYRGKKQKGDVTTKDRKFLGKTWKVVLVNGVPRAMFISPQDGMAFARALREFGASTVVTQGHQFKIVPLDKSSK